jgi:hypothetical protein
VEDFSINADNIVTSSKTARTLRRADVMFLLDCTATMQQTLDVVTSTIDEVVQTYGKSKVNIRLGLVEYRDLTQPERDGIEDLKIHTFGSKSHFTTDIEAYRKTLSTLEAKGGGPLPESTWDAMALAAMDADWDEKADKVMVLFSDAIPYRKGKIVPDVCGLCELLKLKKIDQLHFVIDREDNKKIERFTDILRCVPDVRDPRNTIFGSTYSIQPKNTRKNDRGHFDHLRRVLLNIAKTSGDQAGGNTSGTNPYAGDASTRQQHISGCAIDRRNNAQAQPTNSTKTKKSPLESSTPEEDNEDDDGDQPPMGKKNPYA